jgi:hypothetical protein
MEKSKILDALVALDVDNDDHWTAEGLPRLDVMKGLCGGGAVTRTEVTAANPEFTREVMRANTEEPETEEPETEEPETEEPETEEPETEEVTEEETVAASLDKAVVQKELDEARDELNKAKRRYDKAVLTMDTIIEQEAEEFGDRPLAEDIKAYQNSQKKQRALAANRRKIAVEAMKAAKEKY